MRIQLDKLFQLRLKLRSPNFGDDEFLRCIRSVDSVSKKTIFRHNYLFEEIFFQMCHLPFNLILRENVSQLLRDCLGRNIDAVRIYQWANQDDSVLNLLDEMQFTKLKFDGSKIINEHV